MHLYWASKFRPNTKKAKYSLHLAPYICHSADVFAHEASGSLFPALLNEAYQNERSLCTYEER